MIELLAIQSVDRKVADRISVLTGNYEYYYACGILDRRLSLGLSGDMKPTELFDKVQEALHDKPLDPEGDYLIYLLKRYEPEDKYDEQMGKLFEQGVCAEL